MLLSPNFFMRQSQSSVIKFSSFIFLAPKVSDNYPRVDGKGVGVGITTPNNLVASPG